MNGTVSGANQTYTIEQGQYHDTMVSGASSELYMREFEPHLGCGLFGICTFSLMLTWLFIVCSEFAKVDMLIVHC